MSRKEQYYILLVAGYIREFQENNKLSYEIPSEISQVITMFYPSKLQFFGIGENRNNVFGSNAARSAVWNKLQDLSDKCLCLSSMYINYARIIYKSEHNEIFVTGQHFMNSSQNRFENMTNLTKLVSSHEYKMDNNDPIDIISTGIWNEHCIFITQHNNFYLFGNNNYKSIIEFNKFKDIFNNIKVKKICNGTEHTVFLCENGNMLSCGRNDVGQCGHNSISKTISMPTKIEFDKDIFIKDIEIGDSHNLCLTDNGNLYVFGWNEYGQLLMNNDENNDDEYDKPILNDWFNDKKIYCIKAKCGAWHSIIIDINGSCYVFGHNEDGECGNGSNNGQHVYRPPNIIQFEKINIIEAAAGFRHSVLLTDNDEIYTFGRNSHSQCSVFDSNPEIYSPHLLTKEEIGLDKKVQILNVFATPYSTIVVTQ